LAVAKSVRGRKRESKRVVDVRMKIVTTQKGDRLQTGG